MVCKQFALIRHSNVFSHFISMASLKRVASASRLLQPTLAHDLLCMAEAVLQDVYVLWVIHCLAKCDQFRVEDLRHRCVALELCYSSHAAIGEDRFGILGSITSGQRSKISCHLTTPSSSCPSMANSRA